MAHAMALEGGIGDSPHGRALECTETALLVSAGAGITVGAAVSRW